MYSFFIKFLDTNKLYQINKKPLPCRGSLKYDLLSQEPYNLIGRSLKEKWFKLWN